MRFCNRLIVGVALFSGLAFLPAGAHADTIDFLGVGRASVVSIGGLRSGSFYAGELNWAWIGTPPAGFAQSFYAYCVDVSQNLRDPQTVTTRTTAGFTNGATDGGAKAAWLVNTFADTIHSLTNVSDANMKAAALQVAIWEAMYDNTASLTGGNFTLTGTSLTSTIRTQAQTYLDMLYGDTAGIYNTSVATLLEVRSPNLGQDQIVSRVSEPSTLLLMGVAILAFVRRSRNSAA